VYEPLEPACGPVGHKIGAVNPNARRVLRIDLGALERGEDVRCADWLPPAAGIGRIGRFGGSALGVVLLAEELEAMGRVPAPLVLAVGDGVRRGLPTAARATVLSRAPLTGRLAEGHVGGELGARLAAVADAVVLRGGAERPGAVLRIHADGSVRLESRPELAGTPPARAIAALGAGGAAVLTIGPAGERGLPFASLASGAPRPSFVGRGGLGAVLAGLGLKAIVVEPGAPRAPEVIGAPASIGRAGLAGIRDTDARALRELLLASPRLAARSDGGTLELYGALAASGDLGGRAADESLPRAAAEQLLSEARDQRLERAGCHGCPTPCGWVFEGAQGLRQRARFGATHALGANLGFAHLDDALALLARCDELGLDAKEAGGVLALEARAIERGLLPGTPAFGDRALALERLDAIVLGGDEAQHLRGGTSALARQLGLEGRAALDQGEAAPREGNLAALLGRTVSTGGADPMRSFPFLVGASGRERLARLCASLGPLPPGAEDPHDPAAKGRLVAWHEDVVAAVDATGFCAFSTAGLLADGLVDLDGLARWLLPDGSANEDPAWAALAPGERLLALGANLVLARREIDRRLAERGGGPPAVEGHDERLALPGMLEEYRRWRGLDARGRIPAALRVHLGTPAARVADARSERETDVARPSAGARRVEPPAGDAGRVELRASNRTAFVEMALPARLLEVLARAESSSPALRGRLVARGEPVPAVWRAGERLEADALVAAGDVLDLVTAIGGG
jgi:aldehyde:ferredoxin oxidoreductase